MIRGMTLYFPEQNAVDRWLERIGRPRAYSVGDAGAGTGTFRAVREPLWRSLLRKPGSPPPAGWSFRVDQAGKVEG